MFYEEEDVLEILVCQMCQRKYDEPLMLPCGETICSSCFCNEKTIRSNSHIECPFCNESHEIPRNGFAHNKLIAKLMQLNSKELYRGGYFEKLKSNLSKINEYLSQIGKETNNPVDFIRNHCAKILGEVEEARERAIGEINRISLDIIHNIQKYEEDCVQKLEESERLPEEIVELKTRTNKSYENFSNLLKKANIDEADVIEAVYNSEKCKFELKRDINQFQESLFNGQVPNFKRNLKFNSDMLGDFFYSKSKKSFRLNELSKCELSAETKCSSICILENGKYLISYPSKFEYPSGLNCNLTIFALLDQNGRIIKKVNTDFTSSFKMSYKNFIIYRGYTYTRKFLFEIMDDQLCIRQSIENDEMRHLKKIGSNNEHIFALFCDENFNTYINVYDWRLNLMRRVDDLNYFKCFRIESGNFNSFRVTESNIIFRFGKEVFILSQDEFKLVRSFLISCGQCTIKTSQFLVGNNNELIVLDDENKRLVFYDLDGELIRDFDLVDFPTGLTLDKDKNHDVLFIDHEKNYVYKFDKLNKSFY